MRALALAAAFTSTSLRERWSEPGEEAAAGILEVWAGLAGEGQIKSNCLTANQLDQRQIRLDHLWCLFCFNKSNFLAFR